MKHRKLHLSCELLNMLRAPREVVVITGSGLGVASGLPASRDGLDGLWSRHDPQDLATAEGFRRDPASVWAWNSDRRVRASRAMPNAAHRAIAELAKVVPLMTVITQNGDNLHERAGTRRTIYLHGRLDEAWCPACGVPHVSQPLRQQLCQSIAQTRPFGASCMPALRGICASRPSLAWRKAAGSIVEDLPHRGHVRAPCAGRRYVLPIPSRGRALLCGAGGGCETGADQSKSDPNGSIGLA